LKGAAIVQGLLLAMRLRGVDPDCVVTETHPKALLIALRMSPASWDRISGFFSLVGMEPRTEHERDALIGAAVAREATAGRWTIDLSMSRNADELDPKQLWFGPVNYFWPEVVEF
jgi:hypothetical protein